MKITIEMELTAENLEKIKALVEDSGVKIQADIPAKEDTAPVKEEVKEDTAPDKEITKTDIRAVALQLSKAGKQDVLAEIFKKFGCKKLSDFDKRTEDYPELMRELVKANA